MYIILDILDARMKERDEGKRKVDGDGEIRGSAMGVRV